MLFVGDHVLFDAPQDPRIVFHLEPNALRRPAAELVELVLALRERGRGSLARGFVELLGPAAPMEDVAFREIAASAGCCS